MQGHLSSGNDRCNHPFCLPGPSLFPLPCIRINLGSFILIISYLLNWQSQRRTRETKLDLKVSQDTSLCDCILQRNFVISSVFCSGITHYKRRLNGKTNASYFQHSGISSESILISRLLQKDPLYSNNYYRPLSHYFITLLVAQISKCCLLKFFLY